MNGISSKQRCRLKLATATFRGDGNCGGEQRTAISEVLPTAGLLARPQAGLLARKEGEGHEASLQVYGTLFFAPSPTV